MPVWCAQTWAQWRWHGRMIQDACTGAAVALGAQWTWALPQIPHRPAGWRHVTLHPPGPDKSWVCSAVCAAPRGPGPLLHSQRAWMEAGRLRGRDTGRRCVVTQRRNVWGRCRFIHACGFFAFRQPARWLLFWFWVNQWRNLRAHVGARHDSWLQVGHEWADERWTCPDNSDRVSSRIYNRKWSNLLI